MRVKIYISFFVFSFLSFFCVCLNAQDSHFSQYEYSPLTINPALTGIDKRLQVILHHKDQWKMLNGFRTDELSFEMRFDPSSWRKIKNRTAQFKDNEKKGFAFGINVFSDKAGDGDMQLISGSISLAYHLQLSENSIISAGMQGGLEQRTINPNNLRFNSQYATNGAYDPSSSSGEIYNSTRLTNCNFSVGAFYTFGKEYQKTTDNRNKLVRVGAAIEHINPPTQAYIQNWNSMRFYKYTIHTQARFSIKNSAYSFKTSAITLFQGKQFEATTGFFLRYKMKDASKYTGIKKGMAISLGAYYRYKDAIIPSLQYELSRCAIGLSYDVNISPLRNATIGRGGLEVTLLFFNPMPYLYQKKDS